MLNVIVSNRWNSKEEKYEYGACLKSNGQLNFNEMVERISARCTVTKADIIAVLAAFQEQSIYALRNAQGVSLGEIGNLYLAAQTSRTDTPQDFDISQVKGLHVKMRARRSFVDKMQPGQKDITFRVTKIESGKV